MSVAPNGDITFNYKEQLQLIPSTTQFPRLSVDISVPQLNTMTPSQKVKVTGTLGSKLKNTRKFWSSQHNKYPLIVKEDCTLDDSNKRAHFYSYPESTDNSIEGQLFLSPEQFDSEKLSRQHLPVYLTIHHLYSGGEHPVLFERASNSRNFRETNLCWQLQIT